MNNATHIFELSRVVDPGIRRSLKYLPQIHPDGMDAMYLTLAENLLRDLANEILAKRTEMVKQVEAA